jgi:signal transduction histidine kinase
MKAELKDKDRLKEEFISIASHELRTPIQPILGFVDLARKGKVNPNVAFNEIYNQAIRLKNLANDILDVTKIESGNMVMMKELMSLNDVIRTLVHEKKITLANEVKLEVSLVDDRYATVNVDRERLIQVLSNLINNAAKFTKNGTIQISTSFATGGYGRKSVKIEITDSGNGIPQEIMQRLFTKFASKSVNTGTEHGTGLGLYVSRGIIEAHGGTISASNNQNRPGATFTILLPYEDAGTVLIPKSDG